jgi:hypothetical protein
MILPINKGLCPNCGAADTVVPIVYGQLDQDQWEAMQRGEIVMGGQPVYDNMQLNPTHFCTACETNLRLNRCLLSNLPFNLRRNRMEV